MRCIIFRLITLATMLALILPTGSMATDHITRPPAFEDTTLRSDGLVVAFADDFSVNPNSGGRWTIHRAQGDPSAEASWGCHRADAVFDTSCGQSRHRPLHELLTDHAQVACVISLPQ